MAYCTLAAESAAKLVHSPEARVLHMAWKPGQGEILAGATSKGGKIWNMEQNGTEIVEFGISTDMKWVAWSRDGNLLATVGEENGVWNSVGMRVATLQMEMPVWQNRPPDFSPPLFNNNGHRLILSKLRNGTQDTTGIYVFNVLTGVCLKSMNFDWITPVVWMNEKQFFCGGGLNTINLHDVDTEDLQVFIDLNLNAIISSLAYNEKTGILAAAAGKIVRLWVPTTYYLGGRLTGHTSIVTEMVWHPYDSAILTIIQRNGDVRVWDTQSKTTLHIFESIGLDRFCYSQQIIFSPDGRFLAARGENVKMWKVSTWDMAAVCEVQGAAVSFSPKGNKLAVHSGGVFSLEKIVGINLKALAMIRVATTLKSDMKKNQEEDVKELIKKLQIPEVLKPQICSYLSPVHDIQVAESYNHDLVYGCIRLNMGDIGLHKDQLFSEIKAKVSRSEMEASLEFLSAVGHVYCTVDGDHFKAVHEED